MSVPILINDTMRDWMMGTQSLSPVSGFVVVPNLPTSQLPISPSPAQTSLPVDKVSEQEHGRDLAGIFSTISIQHWQSNP
jgi:hypothetical protein